MRYSEKGRPQEPIRIAAGKVELCLSPVKRKTAPLFNELIQRYHYLGYSRMCGAQMRFFVYTANQLVALLGFSAAAWRVAGRDEFIGWSDAQRKAHLHRVVNNSRFLLFPWVEVANLASHALGQLARRVGDDWQARWGYRPLLLETFVDPARFRGSCYRAAGWALLGRTSGEGLVRPGKQYRTSPKLIFAKPLQADFRALLCSNQLKGTTEL